MTDEEQILNIIQSYETLAGGDAGRFRSLFWSDDPNFTILENDRSGILGAEYIEHLCGIIKARGASHNQRIHNIRVFFPSDDFAYAIFLRDEMNIKATSRVTFVFQRKNDEWRILHSHFSYVPEE